MKQHLPKSKIVNNSRNLVIAMLLAAVVVINIRPTSANAISYCTSYQYGYGGSGQCVKDIQTLLDSYHVRLSIGPIDNPTPIAIDGSFGKLTKARVQALQSAVYGAGAGYGQAINADGIVGPLTWRKLCTLVNSGEGNYIYDYRDKAAYIDANCAKYSGAWRF